MIQKKDLKVGMVLKNTQFPGWGLFRVVSRVEDPHPGWWEIQGDAGERVLFADELCYWEQVTL